MMRELGRQAALYSGLVLLLFVLPVSAASSLELGRLPADILLGPHAEYLEDPTGLLQLQDVRAEERDWQPLSGTTLSAGFSRSVWWLRVELLNDSAAQRRYYLDTGSTVADYIDVHVLRDEQLAQSMLSGDRRDFGSRPLNTHTPVLPVLLNAGASVWLYVRLDTWDGLHEVVSLRLLGEQQFSARLQTQSLAMGVYYGTLIAILLYNLFLYLFIRERVFGRYVFYVAAFVFWSFILRGYGLQYLWPSLPHLNNQLLPLAAGLCYVSFGLFALEYLRVKEDAPRWLYRAYWVSILLNIVAPMPALFGHYALAFALNLPTGLTMVVIAVISGLLMMRRGSRPAKYFLFAFSFLAIGVLLYYLQLIGLMQAGPVPEYGVQIGSALEVLLLAFGLADQMNTLKSDKLRAEKQARLAQQDLSSKLAKEVSQRTAELQQANQRLNELATVDELTGALNRRRFNQLFEPELAQRRQQGLPFAFCMLDIDGFKRYNDVCGHQAGDQVLQQLSECLQAHLSQGQLFRLGGEEFGILLSAAQSDERAEVFIESLRQAVEEMDLSHPEVGRVTASFGLLVVTPGAPALSAHDVYLRADELLYQAKAAGRNCLKHAKV